MWRAFRFDDEGKEQQFRQNYCFDNIRFVQLALVLSALLFCAFYLWDDIIDPGHNQYPQLIRLYLIAPMLIGGALLVATAAGRAWYEQLIVFMGVASSCALTAIYMILDRGFQYGATGPMLVSIFVFSVFQIRLVYLLVFSSLSTGAFFAGQSLDGQSSSALILVNALCVGSAMGLGLIAAVRRELSAREQFRTALALKESGERVEDLLHSMLPREIVHRIQAGETPIADAYGEVAIIFADLVGFTALARRISPSHLVETLNDLFSAFDAVAERSGVERIKTVGDAYMAVCGLERGGASNHAEQAALFALEAQRIVGDISSKMGLEINIRIGLHVGPVVAGVVGTKRPAFDCWGEAVNLASRLETSAQPGGILISEAAYFRLRSRFDVQPLDELDLKGIGPAKVFLLKAGDEELPRMDDLAGQIA